jgi:hypothetical protein
VKSRIFLHHSRLNLAGPEILQQNLPAGFFQQNSWVMKSLRNELGIFRKMGDHQLADQGERIWDRQGLPTKDKEVTQAN